MQPVRSAGRRIVVKKSPGALLARGVAAPSRGQGALTRFAGIARDIASPRTIRLGRVGRDPVRGKWLAFAALFLCVALVYGAWVGGQTGRLITALQGGIDNFFVAAGFGVQRITVEGKQFATDAEITTALEAGPSTFTLAFDTDAAKARLESVPWVKHAQVMRLLPSTIQVVIEERAPFAIWQTKGETFVIDSDGIVLAPALREAYGHLPLVVGEGAGKRAAALLETLSSFTELKDQIVAAFRVGDRRWTLQFTSGLEVLLPDDNVPEALATLTRLDHEHGILERNIAAVDLRLGDRVTVRVRDEAPAGMPVAGSPDDEPPTASTKSVAQKGST